MTSQGIFSTINYLSKEGITEIKNNLLLNKKNGMILVADATDEPQKAQKHSIK